MEQNRIVDLLNELIHVAEDSHMDYQRAAEDCAEEELKALLNDLAAERGAMVRDLQLHVATIGGAPEATGTMLGQAQRMVQQIRAVLGNRDCIDILGGLIQREEETAKRFDDAALREGLPPGSQRVIQDHAARIRADRDRLQSRAPAA